MTRYKDTNHNNNTKTPKIRHTFPKRFSSMMRRHGSSSGGSGIQLVVSFSRTPQVDGSPSSNQLLPKTSEDSIRPVPCATKSSSVLKLQLPGRLNGG